MASDAHAHAGAHGIVQHQFDDLEQQRESFSLGMWLFLATELMMFGGLFFAYSLYRGIYPAAFDAGSMHLNQLMGTINTFVLLVSSLTMAMAVHAAVERSRNRLVLFLVITWILGAVFLGVKLVEWAHDWEIGLIPGLNWTYYDNPAHAAELHKLTELGIGPHHVMLFFFIFFAMTGLHALHMVIGLAAVLIFIWMAIQGKFTEGNDQPVEIIGLYWHLVDIIWVFLFPLLYLIPGLHLLGGGGGH